MYSANDDEPFTDFRIDIVDNILRLNAFECSVNLLYRLSRAVDRLADDRLVDWI